MIKAIIFDLGGVYLTRHILLTLTKTFPEMFNLSVTEDRPRPVFGEHIRPSGFMAGKITEEEYWKLCENDLKVKIDPEKLRNILLEGFEEQKDVVNLIKRLRTDYKLALLSDMPKEWADWLNNKFNIFDNFDESVVSGYTGLEKPEPPIFNYTLERLKLSPEECIFIDDLEKNINGAKNVGINAIRFEGYDKLVEDLKKLGVTL